MRASRATTALAVSIVALSTWPAIAIAHGGHSTEASPQGIATVSFAAAIGLSTLLSVGVGLAVVRKYRSTLAVDPGDGATTQGWMTALLALLGLLALEAAAAGQRVPVALGGAILGGAIAWLGWSRGVSPHDGCADAVFGAVFLHRTVEGILVAGVYAASAAIGLVGLALLTLHAIGETVAIGGLYARLGRGWGTVGAVGIHLGFLGGALVGGYAVGALSPPIVTALLAGVGGVLLVTAAAERRGSTIRCRRHPLRTFRD